MVLLSQMITQKVAALTMDTSRAVVNGPGVKTPDRTSDGTVGVGSGAEAISIEGVDSGQDVSNIARMRAGVVGCSIISVAGETTMGSEVIFGSVDTIDSL
jgi:hypothetical protein